MLIYVILCTTVSKSQKQNFFRFIEDIKQHVVKNFQETIRSCVPAIVYAVQNNLYFIALRNINAAEYTAAYQLRILATALLSVIMLKKVVNNIQWLSLITLLTGVILVQLPQNGPVRQTVGPPDGIFVIGILAVLGMCFTSAFAESLFYGWDGFAWLIVIINAVGGLIVSAVMKYADNIKKTLCQSVAIACVSLFAILTHDAEADTALFIGILLVVVSTYIYSAEATKNDAMTPSK
ncbi:unnamed protein product [Enterobius vermicularis]|uniref:UDP-galactose/UDP-N-acetylglucosamine transporter srf-3 n=1 Tax=Enterobius vermicularis TaxID=51028 RepID=A0A0N4V2X5_ENTVE|nr:unnamed protein product [Enterobius vermicularis]